MFAIRFVMLLILCAIGFLLGVDQLSAQTQSAVKPTFSPGEEEARQAILTSEEWSNARQKFDGWLSVQTMYDAAQVAQMKQEFASRIETMSPTELQGFLQVMQDRLGVLLSPEVTAARDWADELYTREGKLKLARKQVFEDPISMSGEELSAALARFAADRQSRAASRAAFQEAQTAQSTAVMKYRKQQQSAAASAPKRAATYPTPTTAQRSQRSQRYEAPYNPVRYSIGPWGGVWVGH